MRHVYYYEYYPHYMGTMTATVKMTAKEFEELCAAAKVGVDDEAEEFRSLVDALEAKHNVTTYAMDEAFTGRGRATRILNKVTKGDVWAGEWEEGSFAFATRLNDAKAAIRKIEGKHINLD